MTIEFARRLRHHSCVLSRIAMRLLTTLILLTALNCCASSGTTPGPSPIVPSTWGNENETLTITEDAARFDGICVEGTISEPIVVERGMFESAGTLRRKGGARVDDSTTQHARFAGEIAGEQMSFRITREDGTTLVATTLVKGVRGKSRPCP